MNQDDLIGVLKPHLPEKLASDLITQFLRIKRDLATGTLERTSPGKFVETVVQVLQHLEAGKFEVNPQVDNYLRNLESRAKVFPDDLQIILPRVARAIYTIRNK